MIPIARPMIGDEEIELVSEVLRSGKIAQGKFVEEFERRFAEYVGTDYAVAVCNGTVALDLALKALDIRSGDEVIVPSFTFISSANCILFQGARPVFADIDERTFNIDPDDVLEKITKKTKAIIGVHLFGHPFDLKAIMEICEDHKLFLIEDCAQAHGAEYRGKRVGSFGIGCFSFYPTKNMTTCEGGMITTDDRRIAEMCRLLRNHGEESKYNHVILGYNYRMTEVQAVIGIVQLKKLDYMNEIRRRNARFFNERIRVRGLIKPFEAREVKHVYNQYVLRVTEEFPLSRDEFVEYLKKRGIGCAVHYPKPVYKQPLYINLGYNDVRCDVAERVSKEVLSIPVHPALSDEDLRYIVDSINGLGE